MSTTTSTVYRSVMTLPLPATITISRTSEFDRDSVRVQLVCQQAGVLVTVALTLEDFARALTSENNVKAELIRCNTHNA